MRKVVIFAFAGATFGTIIGAVVLGLMSWINERSSDPDWESQWIFAAVFVGAKLGLLLGTILGLIAGLVMQVRKSARHGSQ